MNNNNNNNSNTIIIIVVPSLGRVSKPENLFNVYKRSVCYPEVVKVSFIISFLNLIVKEPIIGTGTLMYINFSSPIFLININIP